MSGTEGVGAFRSDEAHARFDRLLRAAMTRWPAHRDGTVETSFGRTAFSATLGLADEAPLVLLQGGASTLAVWAEHASEWGRDRPVIGIDAIWDAGRGAQRLPLPSGSEAVAWLDEVLEGLGFDRVHLVGYSYGGWLALEYAAAHSARLLSTTAIEPPMAISGMPPSAWWRMLRMILGGEREFRSYLSWVRNGDVPQPEAFELLRSAQTDFVRRGSPRPQKLSDEKWQRITSRLAIVLGGESRLVPARAAARAAQASPHTEVHVIPHAGHAVLAEQPAVIIALVRDVIAAADAAHS